MWSEKNQAQKSTQPSMITVETMAARAKPLVGAWLAELPPRDRAEHGESGDRRRGDEQGQQDVAPVPGHLTRRQAASHAEGLAAIDAQTRRPPSAADAAGGTGYGGAAGHGAGVSRDRRDGASDASGGGH